MALIVILLVVGVILLVAESVLPGMIAGLIGISCLGVAVALGYMRFGAGTGNFLLAIVLVGLMIGFAIWIKFFPNSPLARPFISQKIIGDIGAEKPELLHQKGTAFTQLRPSGTALINGKRVDVVTEGGLIEKGSPVEVVAIEGMRVVVREIN
jgi:membrane-bound serine protease (ClpP class)